MAINILIILAVVQGITEFLPISSSGHLALISQIFPLSDQGILMDIALHLGTLLAVLMYYFKDLKGILYSILNFKVDSLSKEENVKVKYLIIASIPLVIGGALLYQFVATDARALMWIAINSIVFGVALWWADSRSKNNDTLKTMSAKKAWGIGFAQMLAMFPGVSRSGITITAGRAFGINREDSIKFSVLLSIPAIAGAALLGIYKAGDALNNLSMDLLIGGGLSFIASYASLVLFVRFARKFSFTSFAIYRVILGIILLGLI